VAYPPGSPPAEPETLSVQLTCSNGTLANGLRIGDISQPVAGFPAGVSVRNIIPVTPGVLPPLNSDSARRLSTHLALNCLSLANAGNLRSLLELYIFAGNRAKAAVAANRKRVAGIEEVTMRPCDRWVSGVLMGGREVRVKLRKDHFAGPGDMYLFGCLLDRFFGCCAGPNTFTVLSIEETLKGDCCQWKPRLGRQLLP
jgi:type VI secretion system protein ImpG